MDKDCFTMESSIASKVYQVLNDLQLWLKVSSNNDIAKMFACCFVRQLQQCIPPANQFKAVKTRRERMWYNYHKLRCSLEYTTMWTTFLTTNLNAECHPILWQLISDRVFKSLVKKQFPLDSPSGAADEVPDMTNQEVNALRYAAGYVPRALRKKLKQSANPRKGQLLLCLMDLLDDGDEEHGESEKWLDLVDRGGLTRVNETTFQVFLAMETELRHHLKSENTPNFKTYVNKQVLDNEDVAFYWSILSAEWEESDSQALLELVVNLFLTIRGFAYASSWMEKFKKDSEKTLQKSKGLRKTLITTKPSTSTSSQ